MCVRLGAKTRHRGAAWHYIQVCPRTQADYSSEDDVVIAAAVKIRAEEIVPTPYRVQSYGIKGDPT
jgi:hypothetical protein